MTLYEIIRLCIDSPEAAKGVIAAYEYLNTEDQGMSGLKEIVNKLKEEQE